MAARFMSSRQDASVLAQFGLLPSLRYILIFLKLKLKYFKILLHSVVDPDESASD